MTQGLQASAQADRCAQSNAEAPDPDLFRDAMARLASGVAIAACWDGQTPRGLLVSSITALSTEPARVLFCVRQAAASHSALLRAKQCSLAILAEDDLDEAARFSSASRSGERFDTTVWRLVTDAPPQHRAPLTALTGRIGARINAGTHTIFVLDVETVTARRGEPLVYFDRAFRGLDPGLDLGAPFAALQAS